MVTGDDDCRDIDAATAALAKGGSRRSRSAGQFDGTAAECCEELPAAGCAPTVDGEGNWREIESGGDRQHSNADRTGNNGTDSGFGHEG